MTREQATRMSAGRGKLDELSALVALEGNRSRVAVAKATGPKVASDATRSGGGEVFDGENAEVVEG